MNSIGYKHILSVANTDTKSPLHVNAQFTSVISVLVFPLNYLKRHYRTKLKDKYLFIF